MKSDVSVWQAMSGANRDLMIAKPAVPAVCAFLYGAYQCITADQLQTDWLYTLTPTLGGVIAIAGMMVYSVSCSKQEKSIFGALGAMAGFLPYLFGLYLTFFLGLYGIWRSLESLDLSGLFVGVVWIFLGYRMVRSFWVVTELSAVSLNKDDIQNLVLSKRLKPSDLDHVLTDDAITQVVKRS